VRVDGKSEGGLWVGKEKGLWVGGERRYEEEKQTPWNDTWVMKDGLSDVECFTQRWRYETSTQHVGSLVFEMQGIASWNRGA
jgi:hypothetical protein